MERRVGSFFMAARARVTIGQPIDVSQYYDRGNEKAVLEQLTRTFLIEIARLAGVQDYEPRLAGRHWKLGAEEDVSNGTSGELVVRSVQSGIPQQ